MEICSYWPHFRPIVITIFTQVIPNIRPFQNFKIKRQSLPAGTACGLAEWIMDDSCLVYISFDCPLCFTINNSLCPGSLHRHISFFFLLSAIFPQILLALGCLFSWVGGGTLAGRDLTKELQNKDRVGIVEFCFVSITYFYLHLFIITTNLFMTSQAFAIGRFKDRQDLKNKIIFFLAFESPKKIHTSFANLPTYGCILNASWYSWLYKALKAALFSIYLIAVIFVRFVWSVLQYLWTFLFLSYS